MADRNIGRTAGRAPLRLLLIVLLCWCADATGSQATDAAGASAAARQKRAPAAARDEPRAEVLKAICASQFGRGDWAHVDVFRNAAGKIVVLALRPDIREFSHAPHTYFGPTGTEILAVPERPVTPEQRRTDPVIRQQDDLLRSLKESGAKDCKNHR